MCKVKNLIAGGIAFSLALSVNAQNSEDAPAARKKISAPPVVQKSAVQNVPVNDPMSASPAGPNMNRPVQPPVNKQTTENNIQPAKPIITEQAVVEAKAPAKQTVAGPSPFSAGTAASKPAPVAEKSIAGSSQDPNAVAVVPAASKPAGRTPAEIEKAKQLEESQNKVKAPVKEVAAASSPAPVPPPAVEPARPAATTNNQ